MEIIGQPICIHLYMLQQTFPLWFRQVHIINTSKFLKWLYNRLNFLMTEATKDLIIFHDDLNSLHSYIDPAVLPSDYGGMSGPMDNTELAQGIDCMHSYLEEVHRYIFQSHNISTLTA